MVSVVDTAKRALVTLLKSLAAIYAVTLTLTRDSADSEVEAAYKKVSRCPYSLFLFEFWSQISASPFRKFIGF